jgi:hypothetical protein
MWTASEVPGGRDSTGDDHIDGDDDDDDVPMPDASDDDDDRERARRRSAGLEIPRQADVVVAAAAMMVVEGATPSDMHGQHGNLLGRRSFQKFNPSADANWNAALRHANGDDGGVVATPRRNRAAGRRSSPGNERRQDRPIGNLESKLSSRSNSQQGRKRKKTTISNVS